MGQDKRYGLPHQPIAFGQERLPTLIFWVIKLEREHWVVRWLAWFGVEVHTSLLRCAATFFRVALHAGSNHVLPSGRSSLAARYHMIQAELAGWQALPAVLTTVAVASEEIAPVQSQSGTVLLIKANEPHDSWHLDVEMDGSNPIVVIASVLGAKLPQLTPRFEVVVAELPIFDVDDFGSFTIQEDERPARRDNTHCHVVPVQYEDAGV